jgi:hypothetical protein
VSRLRGFAVACAAAACALAAGCAAERVAGVKPSTAQPARTPAAETGACRFTVTAIDDRREQASLGSVGHTRVDGEGFTAWFANGIAAIPGYAGDGAPIELRVEVLKAYVQSLATLKSANLVVRVQVAAAGAPPRVKTYRGVDGSTNWNSTENEIQAAFDAALANLKQQIGADLDGLCRA